MAYWIMTDRGWRPFHALSTPCANSNALEGVYRPARIEMAQASNSARADRFIAALDDNRPFSEPLFGAFGEKL